MDSNSHYGNDKETDYEAVDLGEPEDTRRLSTSSDDCVKTSLRLPAKSLPPRRSLWPFAISATVAFIMIISMSLLLHYLPMLQPDWETSSWIGDDQSVSCDLTTPSDSKVEKAFEINLRSAQQLSFAEAKLVDVLWDLFVGQGGRLLMAWAAYRVFMDGLVSLMETTPVSHDLYVALVFETTTLWTTWKATKALVKSKNWRSRAFVFWFCLATIYTLSFTTLMSAATGYVTPSKAGYTLPNGDFVMPNSEKLKNCFVLEAGALIGETNGTVVDGPQALAPAWVTTSGESGLLDKFPDYYYLLNYGGYPYSHRQCSNDTNDTNYTHILSYYSTESNYCIFNYTTNITWHNHTYTFHNFDFSSTYSGQTYCYDGEKLSIDREPNKKCMPDPYFVWGFSSKLLKVILYFQIAWTFIMLFIWLHANMTSKLLFKNRQVRGGFRASADLAEAMKDVLGDEFCAYSEDEIAKVLARDEKGLRYYTSEMDDKGISHIGIGSHGGVGLDNSRLYGGRRRRQDAGG